jgi:pullulanase/glycogen debranching enzyme
MGTSSMNIEWLNADGQDMTESDWSGPAPFKVMLAESVQGNERARVAVLLNNGDKEVSFQLPDGDLTGNWRVAWSVDRVPVCSDGRTFRAPARSISLLVSG